MNRHERRKSKAKHGKIDLLTIHENCDIQVEAKYEKVVMICANATGREVVERLWPDVEWTRDETFAEFQPPDWSFTHIRLTKLPAHLEEAVPLEVANTESLAFATALALQSQARPRRVVHWSGGDQGQELKCKMYDTVEVHAKPDAVYVAPGVFCQAPSSNLH